MASLMVIFVLLFVATVSNASASRTAVQNMLLESLRAKLTAKGVDTATIHRDERDPYAIVIVMPSSLLFNRDASDVRPDGQKYLQDVVPVLSGILCDADMIRNIDNVVVEGHTDTTYFGTVRELTPDQGQAYNLKLSQARSMEVVKSALQALRDLPYRGCFRSMLSASGRGQEEPLPDVPGDDERQRRVVFKIRVKADLVAQLTARVPSGEAPPR
jgi:outer membrane protein OmpA-like peptidoglycan-associated protein